MHCWLSIRAALVISVSERCAGDERTGETQARRILREGDDDDRL
jgi:hypothetical protein